MNWWIFNLTLDWTGGTLWLHLVVKNLYLSYQNFIYNVWMNTLCFRCWKAESIACSACVITSNLTWEQLAMVLVGRPIDGAQPTSLTQSLWASSFWSSFHCPSSSLQAGNINQWQLGLRKKTKTKQENASDHKPPWTTHSCRALLSILQARNVSSLDSAN